MSVPVDHILQEQTYWDDACLAIRLFSGLIAAGENPGMVVKAQAGPVRDAFFKRLPNFPQTRLPSGVSEDRLIGGLDLGATLATGTKVVEKGILAEADAGILVVPMAEALERTVMTQLCVTLDERAVRVERDGISASQDANFSIVILDESAPGDEGISDALADRMVFHVDLNTVSIRTIDDQRVQSTEEPPVEALPSISDEQCFAICNLASSFGLQSIRPAIQAIAVAKAHASISGRLTVEEEDILVAVRLSLLHRATEIPQVHQEEPSKEENPPESPTPEETQAEVSNQEISELEMPPEEMILDALAASLPADLLAQLKSAQTLSTKKRTKGRNGALDKNTTRGRPLASRRGELRGGNRLDVMATLRAAAPWQNLRRKQTEDRHRMYIRKGDFHIRRFKKKSGSSVIFVVDASGSTALNRLAEAKGAIEILLGESYARRDHVGLVSFRGREAETLLPPTRSLVRAKRALAALPGGGGTPLALGLKQAFLQAEEEQRKGRSPNIVIMTDGSANVDADGQGGRENAIFDALTMARQIAIGGFNSVLIDVGRQPSDRAEELATAMRAAYVQMPFASSKNLSEAVRSQVA